MRSFLIFVMALLLNANNAVAKTCYHHECKTNTKQVKTSYKIHNSKRTRRHTAKQFRIFNPASNSTGHVGLASYYGSGYRTASGERFDPYGFTAAHKSLPFNTRIRVTNLRNGRTVNVRINDRGPFVANRVLDLSLGAARAIGLDKLGMTKVRYERIN